MGVEAQELIRAKAPVPFKLAYKFVLFFMVIYFARPEDWIPGLHVVPLAKIAGILAILAFLSELGSVRQRWPRECVYLFLLLGQMFLTVPFSTVWRGGAFKVTRDFADVVPMILVICLAINTVPRLRRILFWQTASVAVISMVAIVKFRNAGGRLEGVLSGVYSNPNDLALMLVIALPICLAFLLSSRNNLVKIVWLGCLGAMTYAVVLTASRAGILAFAVAMVISLWHFSIKGRHRYLLLIFGGLAVCALFTSGGMLKKRYEAIFNPSEAQSAYGSAQQRGALLKKSIVLTFEYPIFGLGPGNFTTVSGDWHVTHNTYTQISSETGFPGFILYIMILVCAWKNLSRARRVIPRQSELGLFAAAIHGSLTAFLVGSFFASDGYQYFTYFLIAYTTAIYQIAKKQSRTTISAFRPRGAAQKEDFRELPRETAWSSL
jgi:putative inorganic carbon (hco3(-)) transporter